MNSLALGASGVNIPAQIFSDVSRIPAASELRITSKLCRVYQTLKKLATKPVLMEGEGFVRVYYASNEGAVRTFNVCVATIDRWLAVLEKAGWIRRHYVGHERYIECLKPLPHAIPTFKPKRSPVEKCVGSCEEERTKVSPPLSFIRESESKTYSIQAVPAETPAEASASSPVVATLSSLSISVPTACQLLQTYGERAILQQLEALPHRNLRDRAAGLIASLKNCWAIPSTLREAKEKALRDTHRRSEEERGRIRLMERERQEEASDTQWDTLSDTVKQEWQARAEEHLRKTVRRDIIRRGMIIDTARRLFKENVNS